MSTIFELGDDSSDSENDVDYVPSEEDASELSLGENTDDDVLLDDGASLSGKKRKKKGKKANLSVNNEDNTREENDCNKNQNGVCEEDEKKRAESLWQDFLQDVTPPVKKKCVGSETKSTGEVSDKSVSKTSDGGAPKVTVSQVFEFAGEAVVVTKEVDQNSEEAKEVAEGKTLSVSSVEILPSKDVQSSGKNSTAKRPSGGLGSVLGTIMNKKQKLSTLQKTMLDWKSFKKDEGIEEELDQHRRSKDSYVEKQAFLQRSDLRQFEIEKNIRKSNSKFK